MQLLEALLKLTQQVRSMRGIDDQRRAIVTRKTGGRGNQKQQRKFAHYLSSPNRSAVSYSARAHDVTVSKSTHSTAACAPSPSDPKLTVGMPACANKAASIQYATPASTGSYP